MSDIHRQLKGKKVASVLKNGSVLLIQTDCGDEVGIKWVDANGTAIKGEPVIAFKGARIKMGKLTDLVNGKLVGI